MTTYIRIGQPDLNSFILLPPSTYEPGDTLSGTVRVSNFGNATSNSGYVDLFLHRSSPSYSSFDRIEHEFYAPISVGGTDSSSFSYRIPVNTVPGTYYLTCKADATNTSDESNENNNTYQKTITIIGKPDLIVENIWVEPSTVITGSNYVINARIRNTGDTTASVSGSSQNTYFFVNGVKVGGDLYDDLSPNESVVVHTASLSSPVAGSHSVKVTADANNEVDEKNETNNSRTESFMVTSVLPDLIVQSISIDPGYGWQPTTLAAIVKNQGTVSAIFEAQEKICRFEVDDQVQFDTKPSSLTINPGETAIVMETFTVSGVGSYSITVQVDPENKIVESSETNNTLTQSKTWVASSTHDTDGDGMIDADEVIAGSQPDNGSNVWECAMVSTNTSFMITWPSISNRWYNVERTYNLTNDFVVIVTNLPATPPKNSYWDETISNAFYRIDVRE